MTIGAEIAFDETRFRTTDPGRVVATAAGELFARTFGEIHYLSRDEYYNESLEWVPLAYEAGDSFGYLQERAEGGCLITWQSAVREAEYCPWLTSTSTSGFRVASEPITEWWIRVTDDAGSELGWLLIEPSTVDLLQRAF